MLRLKSRQRFIPNGFQFRQPEINWSAPPNSSFQTVVNLLIAARRANPEKQFHWTFDSGLVAAEVDAYNAKLCEVNGWHDYIIDTKGGAFAQSPPYRRTGPLQASRNLAAGAKIVIKWIASGAEAVPQEQANKRAEVCVACPLNSMQELSSLFTVPVQNAIRAALEARKGMNLSTPFDDRLGVCTACDCPMRLKSHVPLDKFLPDMTEESKAALHPSCWITKESQAQ